MSSHPQRSKSNARFVVELNILPGASREDVRRYIEDAVTTMRGLLRPPNGYFEGDPGDPLFRLDRNSVKVRHFNRVVAGLCQQKKRAQS